MNLPDPPRRLIYHFTHLDNLPAILATGALVSDTAASSTGLSTDVGDPGVKTIRRGRPVPVGPGGVVADYVPFYFAPRSPMMYRIACDHRDSQPGRYQGGDAQLVYLVSSIEQVLGTGQPWVASDGNCAATLTTYTDVATDLDTHVDWEIMTAKRWANTPDDGDRMRRRMAEFLIHTRAPLNLMIGLATHSDDTASDIRGLLSQYGRTDVRVATRAHWYYGFRRER